jgi:hypothetical protein
MRSGTRRLAFSLLLLLAGVAVVCAAGELLVRRLQPQTVLYPRYLFSPDYGPLTYPNRVMTHAKPGQFVYRYTTNARHHRGRIIPVSNTYPKTNVVVLGDSYAFGMGVNDGEEFPARLQARLRDTHDVISLAAPGWTLVQQVRRYYELGQLYDPGIVILQFCRNDVAENLLYPVTTIRDGRFVFGETGGTAILLKRWLSRSPFLRSQLYSYLSYRISSVFTRRRAEQARRRLEGEGGAAAGEPVAERLYVELLDLFARDLAARGKRLLVIAANGQIDEFPPIRRGVMDLDAQGVLRYLEVRDWLGGMTGYESPEGHVWGVKAHDVIAQRLAEIVGPAAGPASSGRVTLRGSSGRVGAPAGLDTAGTESRDRQREAPY